MQKIPLFAKEEHDRPSGAAAEVARTALVGAVLASLIDCPITLIIAPPLSGKGTLIRQVRAHLAGMDVAPAVQIIENFGELAPAQQAQAAQEIEASIPAGHHWIVTSDRSVDTFFTLHRIRGQVGQFSMPDLALANTELKEFIGSLLCESIPDRLLHGLNERAGGWIGAWCLLRNLLSNGHGAAELVRSFSGRDRDMVAYFEQHIMPRLEVRVADILRDIAPLAQVREEVVRSVTGHTDAGALLRAAVRDCGFVIDVDRNGEHQRLHPLFRDFLNAEARYANPERQDDMTARFAEISIMRGDWLEAARLFSASNNIERAVEILRRFADELITGRGEVARFRQLIASMPHDAPLMASLRAEVALASIFAGDFAGAAALLEQANGAGVQSAGEKIRLEAIGMSVDFGLERFHSVLTAAPRWLELHSRVDPRYRAVVAIALFWSCMAELDSSGAYRALGIARTAIAGTKAPFLDGWLSIAAAAHKFAHGQVAGAVEVLDTASPAGIVRHTTDLFGAALAYELGQKPQAEHLIRTSLHTGVRHSVVETSLHGWATAARLAAHDVQPSAVMRILQEAETWMANRHGERARKLVRLLRATLILQAPGDAALSLLEVELNALCEDEVAQRLCASYRETARITLARYHARCGDPRRAISIVQPIQSEALRVNRIGTWGEAALIHSGALARRGDANRAMRKAWQAVTVMAESGYSAKIIDEHILLLPLIDGLLHRAQDNAAPPGPAMVAAINALARRAGRLALPVGPESPDSPLMIEAVALTDTERRVLGFAAHGLSNAEIAGRMAIGVTTVKWHLKNVFAKLAVKSRTAAFVQARRLGMDL